MKKLNALFTTLLFAVLLLTACGGTAISQGDPVPSDHVIAYAEGGDGIYHVVEVLDLNEWDEDTIWYYGSDPKYPNEPVGLYNIEGYGLCPWVETQGVSGLYIDLSVCLAPATEPTAIDVNPDFATERAATEASPTLTPEQTPTSELTLIEIYGPVCWYEYAKAQHENEGDEINIGPGGFIAVIGSSFILRLNEGDVPFTDNTFGIAFLMGKDLSEGSYTARVVHFTPDTLVFYCADRREMREFRRNFLRELYAEFLGKGRVDTLTVRVDEYDGSEIVFEQVVSPHTAEVLNYSEPVVFNVSLVEANLYTGEDECTYSGQYGLPTYTSETGFELKFTDGNVIFGLQENGSVIYHFNNDPSLGGMFAPGEHVRFWTTSHERIHLVSCGTFIHLEMPR